MVMQIVLETFLEIVFECTHRESLLLGSQALLAESWVSINFLDYVTTGNSEKYSYLEAVWHATSTQPGGLKKQKPLRRGATVRA
jgi:hypothetical protein